MFASSTRIAYALIGAVCAYAAVMIWKLDFSDTQELSFYEHKKGLEDLAKFFGTTLALSLTAFYAYFDMPKSAERRNAGL